MDGGGSGHRPPYLFWKHFYVFLLLNQLLPGQTELTSEMRELRDRCHEQVEFLIAKWDRVATLLFTKQRLLCSACFMAELV